MPAHWYTGTVRRVSDLSPGTRQFDLTVDSDGTPFSFVPGQFITVDLPVGDKRRDRWRSYSIANEPNGQNFLELCIVRSSDGPGTRYLFEEMIPGSELIFKGPDGGFVIPEDLDREIVMVCTGTGVAPFRSMIRHIMINNLPFRGIHLIFGTRREVDILYREEFESYASENPKFRYSVALSREVAQGFYHGYVHSIYMDNYSEKTPDRYFYICGWSKMIDEAVENLIIKLKYDKSQVKYELYG